MLTQNRLGNGVDTLGTATSPQHVAKWRRVVGRVVFALDSEAAGRRAAWQALESCLPQLLDTRRIDFLFLPAEHDPDSFVREYGAQGFAKALEAAVPLSEFFLGELCAQVDLQSPEGRARLQALARPHVQSMPPVALRLQLMQAIATRAGISTQDFTAFVAQAERSAGFASGYASRGSALPIARESSDHRSGGLGTPREAFSACGSDSRCDESW